MFVTSYFLLTGTDLSLSGDDDVRCCWAESDLGLLSWPALWPVPCPALLHLLSVLLGHLPLTMVITAVLLCYSVIVFPCYCVTLLLCYLVTVLLCSGRVEDNSQPAVWAESQSSVPDRPSLRTDTPASSRPKVTRTIIENNYNGKAQGKGKRQGKLPQPTGSRSEASKEEFSESDSKVHSNTSQYLLALFSCFTQFWEMRLIKIDRNLSTFYWRQKSNQGKTKLDFN